MHSSVYTVIVNETLYRSGFALSAQIIYHTVCILWAAKLRHSYGAETAAAQKTQHVCPAQQKRKTVIIKIKRDM